MESTRPVDRHLAIDLIAGKDHHPADRVADAIERFALHFRDLIDDVRQLRRTSRRSESPHRSTSQNSPSSERWCRYVRGVVTSSSNGAPLGNGLLQRSW